MMQSIHRVWTFSAERPQKGVLLVKGTMEDLGQSLGIEVEVSYPALEILSVKGEMRRVANPECHFALAILDKATGLKIKPGIAKEVRRRIGFTKGCLHLTNLVIEACRSAVHASLNATLLDLKAEGKDPSHEELLREWLRRVPILKNTCYTLAEEGPLFARLGLGSEATPR